MTGVPLERPQDASAQALPQATTPLARAAGSVPTGLRAHAVDSVDATLELLGRGDYVADRALATAVFLAMRLARPLFVEGEPGTGKTEIAKVLALALGAELIRLQCYEGLDIHDAAYEWNYARQMLEIRLGEAHPGVAADSARAGERRESIARELFSERFLIARPLLRALQPHAVAPVLLIDELDRADEPFEAFLLEVLSDFQITIPEWTTVKAQQAPLVVITSNRTREIHDAVKRRCIYHWVGYPDAAREFDILRRKAPECSAELSRQVVAFVQAMREIDLYKLPGVSETIEWAHALIALDAVSLEPLAVENTLGVLLKYQDDIARMQGSEVARLLERVRLEATRT
ncbi:carbon monoxide dehydrogenase, ATPase accessory protein coxD [Burkholderiales bacterium]|nr:carbon monoxide dehydrogenase, ATPase accessory protein coxD [Burkholderiales bacterium]